MKESLTLNDLLHYCILLNSFGRKLSEFVAWIRIVCANNMKIVLIYFQQKSYSNFDNA